VQVNTIWEGSDNILSPDVRPGIERTQVHEPLLECLLRCCIDHLEVAITAWRKLRRAVAEARLFLRARFIGDGFAGALLIGQAARERAVGQIDRKALVARLYALRDLADQGPFRGIDAPGDDAMERLTNSSTSPW
jgi:acyl-CoA dehydrogenase